MITQEEAIELALETCRDDSRVAHTWMKLTHDELTALCNAVRKQTLLEAAETWETIGYSKFKTPAEELRRMAGE